MRRRVGPLPPCREKRPAGTDALDDGLHARSDRGEIEKGGCRRKRAVMGGSGISALPDFARRIDGLVHIGDSDKVQCAGAQQKRRIFKLQAADIAIKDAEPVAEQIPRFNLPQKTANLCFALVGNQRLDQEEKGEITVAIDTFFTARAQGIDNARH
ncbi:MAG: hypothetical protein KGI37_01105 [Alphaproteobacteria bacterium]|nr:hypothetical protein [Alphaproteobacteria bacterium]